MCVWCLRCDYLIIAKTFGLEELSIGQLDCDYLLLWFRFVVVVVFKLLSVKLVR